MDRRLMGGGPLVLPLPAVFSHTSLYHVTLPLDGDLSEEAGDHMRWGLDFRRDRVHRPHG
jgi:hypothetical protein